MPINFDRHPTWRASILIVESNRLLCAGGLPIKIDRHVDGNGDKYNSTVIHKNITAQTLQYLYRLHVNSVVLEREGALVQVLQNLLQLQYCHHNTVQCNVRCGHCPLQNMYLYMYYTNSRETTSL
jgi:hypothetical protein